MEVKVPKSAPAGSFNLRMGNTTYLVSVHFSKESRDTLAIPCGALNRGDTVLITAGSPSAVNALDQEAPEGYVYVEVETGVSDGSYIEVTSGLQEGDTVAYIRVSSSGDSGMMMGGMPGGMPGSGMPSGGMPSGGRGGGGPMG